MAGMMMLAEYPKQVKVVEVGPRDGLQNEAALLKPETKIELLNRLSDTGLKQIEATSFVSPTWTPQLADAEQVWQGMSQQPGVVYAALVPNLQGLERAIAVGVQSIAVFTAVSESFCQHNMHCSINESLIRYAPVIKQAKAQGIGVRAYISTVFGCPYEGRVDEQKVLELAKHFIDSGCQEVSLGDTVGYATALQAKTLIARVARRVPVQQLAVHFHDTRGQALANVLACLEVGVAVVDSAVAGLGGCPYAPGASGNLATEDLVYFLNGMNIQTDIDLAKVISTGRYISKELGRKTQSRMGLAGEVVSAPA